MSAFPFLSWACTCKRSTVQLRNYLEHRFFRSSIWGVVYFLDATSRISCLQPLMSLRAGKQLTSMKLEQIALPRRDQQCAVARNRKTPFSSALQSVSAHLDNVSLGCFSPHKGRELVFVFQQLCELPSRHRCQLRCQIWHAWRSAGRVSSWTALGTFNAIGA